MLYLLKTGCRWRMLPGEFAPWTSVYYYFRSVKTIAVGKVIFADQGYMGGLGALIERVYGWILHVVRLQERQRGFQVLPKRWVVERTFGWFESYRRLSNDKEFPAKKAQRN